MSSSTTSLEIPNDNSLCQICNEIDFSLLHFTWPIPGWIPEAEALSYEAYPSYDLGELGSILERAEECVFCAAIRDAFGTWQKSLTEKEDYDDAIDAAIQQATCKARMTIEGYIDQDERPDLGDLLRLTVIINFPEDIGDEEICFAFQAGAAKTVQQFCDLGTSSISDHSCYPFSGRVRSPLADCRLFIEWMQMCDKMHTCRVQPKETMFLRFIDVQEKCIVEDTSGAIKSYVALSYVWGTARMLCLMKENLTSFTQPRGLLSKAIPLTISDSMLLTENLGLRYLWVDSLCIIQDDNDDKAIFIPRMNTIYHQSMLTIVAASGADANAGLPGLRPNTRVAQESLVAKGVPVLRSLHAEPNDFDHYLSYTTWHTRGWTMQERALSTRALIFTTQQVYWECQECSWCEEAEWEPADGLPTLHRAVPESTLRLSNSSPLVEEKINELNSTYRTSVMQYTQRQFSFEGDVLDAFEGILSSFKDNTSDEFFWALPESIFSAAIAWYRAGNVRRNAKYNHRSPSKGNTPIPFPSWSWLGWTGSIALFPPLNTHSSELTFFRLGPQGKIVQIQQSQGPGKIPDDNRAWDYDDLRSTWKSLFPSIVHDDDIPKTISTSTIAPALLFFYTSSSKLLLTMNEDDPTSSLYDVRTLQGLKLCSMMTDLPSTFPFVGSDGTAYDFIVISRDLSSFQPMLYILLILEVAIDQQQSTQGYIAYRQGISTIKEQTWGGLTNKVWRLVTLG